MHKIPFSAKLSATTNITKILNLHKFYLFLPIGWKVYTQYLDFHSVDCNSPLTANHNLAILIF